VRARAIASSLAQSIGTHLADGHRGEILREGFQVVIAGPPNVGKSSLLNALARREAAIVSPEAGTTRDVIEVALDVEGLPVILSDTAGIRDPGGEIEREGIRRTIERGSEADLVLWVMDARTPERDLPADLAGRAERLLGVLNKIDLLPPGSSPGEIEAAAVSATTGEGLAELSRRIARIARERIGSGASVVLTQARHREALSDCAGKLQAFLSGDAEQVELRAEDLRGAAQALGRLTGRVDAELVLDRIFSRFCIGK
jgi:tRNA modification GTPase